MKKLLIFIPAILFFQHALTQNTDSISWIQVRTDSGIVHAAIAIPKGHGPFPAIIILHGTHGFAEEYVKLALQMAQKGFVGIAVCWFKGRKGEGTKFITPINFDDAPPLIEATGSERFRLARIAIDSIIQKVSVLSYVNKHQVAIFGHSRGAGAALYYSMAEPDRVQALILNSSGYPPEVSQRTTLVKRPVLILHGIKDGPSDGGSAFSNIEMARKFENALRSENKKVEVKYYEEGTHNSIFSNPDQFDESIKHITSFLQNIFSR